MTLFNDPVHPVWQHCIWWLYAVTLFDDTVWWTYVMALHDGPVWWSWIVLLCLFVLFVRTLLSLLSALYMMTLMLLPCLMTQYDGPMWWPCMMTQCNGLELCFSACLCCLCHSSVSVSAWLGCFAAHSLISNSLCFCLYPLSSVFAPTLLLPALWPLHASCKIFTWIPGSSFSCGSHFHEKKWNFTNQQRKNFSSRIARHGGNRLVFFFG